MTKAVDFRKGMKVRTTRARTAYMSKGDRVIAYPDYEVRDYRVEAVYPGRNKIKLSPAGPLAYGCILSLDTFPGKVEAVA